MSFGTGKDNQSGVQGNYLAEKIGKLIDSQGPISFNRFMALALYHPGLGYYCQRHWHSGGEGDFYTGSDLGNTYGYLLAWYFYRCWIEWGCPDKFMIIECGPGLGKTAFDVLSCIKDNWPEFGRKLNYYLVEIGDGPRRAQKIRLCPLIEHGLVIKWAYDLNQVPRADKGIVFANELLDAMPFQRLRRVSRNSVREIKVGLKNDSFIEVLSKPAWEMERQKELIPEIRVGQEIEVCLQAKAWLRHAANIFASGKILIIDYGYLHQDLSSKPLKRGTLRCYYQHRVDDNPYKDIGLKDITADVNFSAVRQWAKDIGLSEEWFSTQGKFIFQLLNDHKKDILSILPSPINRHALTLATLTTPGGMGDLFKVAIFNK